jgi:predicted neuraminidase
MPLRFSRSARIGRVAVATLAAVSCLTALAETSPRFSAELIFPLEDWHNHGSCVVECPDGSLLACWFHGSGERKSDDVEILGARYEPEAGRWSAPFPMADTPSFPDTNCCMIIDPETRLWLLWPTIQANLWESALMKIKRSNHYMTSEGPPAWDEMDVMHVKHEGDFAAAVDRKLAEYLGEGPFDPRVEAWIAHVRSQAADKLTRRLGWFTRAHPLILPDGRMLVGLYSDGFSFSLVGITDDGGRTWTYSEPIVGGGNIQPSFATRRDGGIVAYMRDNGPPPKRVLVSESNDRGRTWSRVVDHPTLPNPGAGLEVMTLRNGDWLCVFNDLEEGRHSLAVAVSHDEGMTWPVIRHLERDATRTGSFHYPSVIEASDGTIHVTYSYFAPQTEGAGKSIKHARFTRQWLEEGDSETAGLPAVEE